jgi:hypothetical protein
LFTHRTWSKTQNIFLTNICLAVHSFHEVGVEDLSDEVERVPFDEDERQQKVDDLFRRKFDELVLLKINNN